MAAAGLEPAPSVLVKPPRVKASPCALECKLLQTCSPTTSTAIAPRFIVIGQVVGIHIDERFIRDGRLDTAAMQPIARAGYQDYFVSNADTRFTISSPRGDAAFRNPHAKPMRE